METLHVTPGAPDPLGATWDGPGTNFALYSEGATGVVLCLVDEDGSERQVAMKCRSDFVWHVYVHGIGPGQRYGYRVDGPWEPERGQRFNPRNRLLDPYARALGGTEEWERGAFSYAGSGPDADLTPATEDQRGAPLGLVTDPTFDWGDDAPPDIQLRRTIIYEAHVKGLTALHPDIPEEVRGTYLGLASQPVIRHLQELGITALELLPVHGFADDLHLVRRGLRNYWGYSSLAFFAPDVRYRSGTDLAAEVTQFKRAVKALHAAGIEVIIDVVYSHTAEGGHLGPTFSLRGVDNATYYRLVAENPRYYFDYTGRGNSINVMHPQALRLIMDSLRYWVEEMHVDGFRFDRAPTLARGLYDVDQLATFFTIIHQDPVIRRVKLIAEPWDLGQGGYRVGRFPLRWSEWNGKYRDTMRAFWRGDGGRVADLAYRLTGSSDLYQQGGRSPASSVNFIASHDGFTLRDLVTYERKHNAENLDDDSDNAEGDLSSNAGVEGETDSVEVNSLRARQQRNMLATLFLSQGVPMLAAGDELGRTQHGNNNAYCQDSAVTWVDWALDDRSRSLLKFVRRMSRIRRAHPLLEQARFFRGEEIRGVGARDIAWFRSDGAAMNDEDWASDHTASLGVFLAGSGIEPLDEAGKPQNDDDLLLIFNAGGSPVEFTLPRFVERGRALAWSVLVDTCHEQSTEKVDAGGRTEIPARSLKVFSRRALGPGGLGAAYGAPTSTYRMQLQGLGFGRAAQAVGYLDRLGVGGLYTSPYLRAAKGSGHGYDVVDHVSLDPALGSQAEFLTLTDEVKRRGMSHLLDFVPNHVGIGTGENAWFWDVLENGQASTFAEFFDIDWEPPSVALSGRLLLPVLGRQFGDEVNAGNIGIERVEGRLQATYYERRFPASPRSYGQVLSLAMDELEGGANRSSVQELESLIEDVSRFPQSPAERLARRPHVARERDVLQRRLARLCRDDVQVASALDSALRHIATKPERLESFLHAQHYRLSYWKVATEEINYRRFFDVNELAAIRMEDPRVFHASHALVLDLIRSGRVTALRLDHTDGLYDPEGYLRHLQSSIREALRDGGLPTGAPMYVVAEKILEPGEELPRDWALSGSTGYDYLAVSNDLWVDGASAGELSEQYARFTGDRAAYADVTQQAKRDVMMDSFSSEIHFLSRALKRAADETRHARDFTLPGLTRAVRETIAAFPVYRTYIRATGERLPSDERNIEVAIARAKRANPRVDPSLFDFLRDVLLLRDAGEAGVAFAMKFQQVSGPIMAKGVEDTANYRANRLICLNEVGGDPSRFGGHIATYHAHNEQILARWPLSMTTTSTHDTKESEDVRCRLAVLSEVPDEWATLVADLEPLTPRGDGASAEVSRADAYVFFQCVVGALPYGDLSGEGLQAFEGRLAAHALKAAREAKVATSWGAPEPSYEQALDRFVRGSIRSPAFMARVARFVDAVAPYGAANSLSQLALRLAAPGVPDIYQGCESWKLSLVDPDNRAPVAFHDLEQMLSRLEASEATPDQASELVRSYRDGRIKLFLTWKGLSRRRASPGVFLEGSYRALDAGEHAVAFERAFEGRRLVCVVPRHSRKLTKGACAWALGSVWGTTPLPLGCPGELRDVFTGKVHVGETLAMADVLSSFPVAWLANF